MNDNDRFLSVRQAAERTTLSRRTLQSLLARGELPCYRVGGRVLLKWNDVLALIERGKEVRSGRKKERRLSAVAQDVLDALRVKAAQGGGARGA